jgi:hypothetical protein
MNQYQANHNESSKSGGTNGLVNLLRVVLILAVVALALWFWS